MAESMYVVTHIRGNGEMTLDVEEYGSRNAAIGHLKALAETYDRLEAYRATLTRESGDVVLRAEAMAPGPSGKLVQMLSRYEIVERVA